ncbi:MAG: Rieske 2Fe-2S domain-containing protein [Erythrobacter sp.]
MATLRHHRPAVQRIDKTPQPAPQLSSRPIEGRRYWSHEFMEREWDKVWTPAWLIGGLARQVARPGDYFTYEIGRESILVTHGDHGQIRALYNVCPHRGKRLACSYHGWRFTH